MNKCKICGSYAINPHCYDRDDTDIDLCDVHYWKTRAESTSTRIAELEAQIKRAEEQEPVRFLYKDVYSFEVLYGDIVTNTRRDCSYKDSRGEWIKGQPLYTKEPK